MKQADIRTGQVLLWNSSPRWDEGHGANYKVEVVDAKIAHWYISSDGRARDHGAKCQNPYGIWTIYGVVVRRPRPADVPEAAWKGHLEVAPARQLRGDWDATSAMLGELEAAANRRLAERQRQIREEEELRSGRTAWASGLADQLVQRGAQRGRDLNVIEGDVVIKADLLEAMINALPLNWTYEH